MKNLILDATAFTNLMNCPRLYDFRMNRSLVGKGGKSNALEVGSLAHFILEHYARAIIAGKSRNDALSMGFAAGKEYCLPWQEGNLYLIDKFHTGLSNTPAESGKDEFNRKVIGYNYVFNTMDQYFDFWRNDSFTIIGAEEVRGEVIYEDSEIRILWKAKFDRIIDSDNGMMSMDHKTMSSDREIVSLNNQFMGQCVLLKSRNVIVDKIGWQSSLKPAEKFKRELVSYSADRLAEWRNEILPYYANMLVAYNESENYPPNFNHCDKYFKCQFLRDVCSIDRNLRDDALNAYFEKGKTWDISND